MVAGGGDPPSLTLSDLHPVGHAHVRIQGGQVVGGDNVGDEKIGTRCKINNKE